MYLCCLDAASKNNLKLSSQAAVFTYYVLRRMSAYFLPMHAQVIVELQEKGASPVVVKQTLSSFLALAPSQVGPTRHRPI